MWGEAVRLVEHYSFGVWGEIPAPTCKLRRGATPKTPASGRAAISAVAETGTTEPRVKAPKSVLSVNRNDVRDLRQPEGKLRSSYPLKNA